MPLAKIRITHLGSEGRLQINTIRQDVPGGEPHSLGNTVELDPEESKLIAVYSGCAIVISPAPKS